MTSVPIPNPSWDAIRSEFEPDGSWRDIYVFDTTQRDWQTLLDWVRRGDSDVSFTVDGEPVILPRDVAEVFQMRETAAPTIIFQRRGIGFKAHFFGESEIELDFDPRDVREFNWSAFVAVLSDIAQLLAKPVVVTPENLPDVTILEVTATSSTYYPGEP